MERKLKIVSVGEEKVASDNRAYYALEVIDAANPFAPSKKRNIFQQFDSEGNAVGEFQMVSKQRKWLVQ